MNSISRIISSLTIILTVIVFTTSFSWAAPVSVNTAKKVGKNFLCQQGLMKMDDTLTFNVSFTCQDEMATPCFYIFNYGAEGFVIVSADDRSTPILGYSMNGLFNLDKCPTNMKAWLQCYAHEIASGIEAQAPEDPEKLAEWKELMTVKSVAPDPKEDSYLLSTTWEQGWGYNSYCPVMNGRHVVVGCVATAMAQIIKYYEYPHRGFGKKSYQHSVYGPQAVDFDTVDYDYSLMPDHIGYGTSSAERDMTSRLCYHCGVVVNMQYQHEGHPSGSGSYTYLVPEGLKYFGYTDAIYYQRANVNDDVAWRRMIRNEIDNLRPIEYAGVNDEGGHAFVLDGYKANNQFHFNWGWGGYCDGFYSLNTMQGFTSNNEMVINIKPSGWEGSLERFYVSANGQGNGTSWAQANSDLQAAVQLCSLVDKDIWMQEGTYYGDTTATYAYTLNGKANIFGGFAGTETEVNQRNIEQHPTIIDGLSRRGLLKATGGNISSKKITINGLVLQNGYSEQGNVIELKNNYSSRYMTIRNCVSDSGTIVYMYNGLSRNMRITNNNAPTICLLNDAVMRQSLISNNNGTATELRSGRIVNSDIVSNAGLGVALGQSSSLVNTIVWNNDSCLRLDAEPRDTAVRYCAFDCDSAILDSTSILLSTQNNHAEGPAFIQPSIDRGTSDNIADADWHLARGSRCIDAGVRIQESIRDGDMDGNIRCRNNFIDMGCFETNYPVGISHTETPAFSILPNPATTHISIKGFNGPEIQIFDMTGRQVLSQPTTTGTTVVNISSLPRGVYFLKAGSQTSKLIKQ